MHALNSLNSLFYFKIRKNTLCDGNMKTIRLKMRNALQLLHHNDNDFFLVVVFLGEKENGGKREAYGSP